jgi:uncharacterized phiE125 gp8 family phage protein
MAYPSFTIDSKALVALLSVKEHLGITEADTSKDNMITRMINASSQMIENYIGRKVLSRTYTEYYDGRGNDRILLDNYPIISVAELWDDSGSTFTNTANKFAASDFGFEVADSEKVGILLLNGEMFGKGVRNIKVIYDAGYATTPYIIQEACILHVEYMYDMRSDRRIGTQTRGKNQESTTYLGDLPPFVMNMLQPYIRVEVPLAYRGVSNT